MNAIVKPLDASGFLPAKTTARMEFIALLEGFVKIYDIIIASGVTLPNNEEAIRDEFLKHIKDARIANNIGPFKYYSTDAEPKENRAGYLDLKITPRRPGADPMEYFSIECKRLDDKKQRGKSGLNAKYVKDGLDRYRKGKYSVYHNINGMFGFIVADINIHDNVQCINGFLASKEHLKQTHDVNSFDFAYLSKHESMGQKTFELYHLMFNFASRIKTL